MPTHDEERKGQTKPLRSLCFTYLEISLFILEKHLLPCQFIADTHRSRIATRIDWSNIQSGSSSLAFHGTIYSFSASFTYRSSAE